MTSNLEVKAIFCEAAGMEPHLRTRFVADACRGLAGVERDVWALLESLDSSVLPDLDDFGAPETEDLEELRAVDPTLPCSGNPRIAPLERSVPIHTLIRSSNGAGDVVRVERRDPDPDLPPGLSPEDPTAAHPPDPPRTQAAGVPAEPGWIALGQTICGRYRLEERIGSGGFGVVYRASDLLANRAVALKFFKPAIEDEHGTATSEITALRLLRLPGVVEMLDEGIDAGRRFVVTELIDGSPFPGRGGAVPWDEILPLVHSFLQSLFRVHWAGIVHGDLKPSNVLVDREGRVTILDLGTSREAGRAADPHAHVRGTPSYLAPELLDGKPATVESDLYAVGRMIFDGLVGAGTRSGVLQRIWSPHAAGVDEALVRFDVPAHVVGALSAMLDPQPELRPSGVAQVFRALRLDGEESVARTTLPLLGREDVLGRIREAIRAGTSVDIAGRRQMGKTRVLDEIESWAGAEGFRTRRLNGCSSGEPWGDLEDLRRDLSAGVVLLVDDADQLDVASGALITAIRGAGCVVRTLRGTAQAELSLAPLSLDALHSLVAGPDRIFHLRSDFARLMRKRTGGVPGLVEHEVLAWIRSGIARWEDGKLSIDGHAVRRVESSAWIPTGLEGSEPPSGPHAQLIALVQLAGPHADLQLISEVLGTPEPDVERVIDELESSGQIVRLPRDRYVAPKTRSGVGLPEATVRRLLEALPRDSVQRVHVRLATRSTEGLEGDLVLIARGYRRRGHLGSAVALLTLALGVARDHRSRAVEAHVLRDFLQVAFEIGSEAMLDRALYEFGRVQTPSEGVLAMEELLRAALRAKRRDSTQALAQLDRLGPMESRRLERWRQSSILVACHGLPIEVEEQHLQAALEWASGIEDPEIVAAAAVWNGWFAYRSGRFDRAALYQASVAAHSGQPVQRIDAALSATSNWMEWGDLARSRRVARKALTQARSLRVPELEARAEWLVRAVAYRAEESLEVDTELIEAVGDLRCCNVRALVLLNEAAIAWRNGELGRTADLATRAAEDWERLGNECASTLARALAAASAKRHGDDFELIRQGTAQCVAPDLQVQALALLGLAYPEYKPELREIAVRSVAGWHGPKNRLDVLSVRESLMYLSD